MKVSNGKRMELDIRWEQRFSNYNKALAQLERFLLKKKLNEMEEQGLIKAFEYTYELAWKTLQDLLKSKGYFDINGPNPVFEKSFHDGYIKDGIGWAKLHRSRNLTSHTYEERTARDVLRGIREEFYLLFKDLQKTLEEERSGPQRKIFE